MESIVTRPILAVVRPQPMTDWQSANGPQSEAAVKRERHRLSLAPFPSSWTEIL